MPPEQLFIQTNAADANEVAVFQRNPEGTLSPTGRFRTDGFGTGVHGAGNLKDGDSAGVDSQGALALSADREFLFAVNAGSNEISSFAFVSSGGLRLVGKVPSGGPGPVSIAVHGNLLYVANRFGAGEIVGFTVKADGRLSPLTGSRRPLSAAPAAPAQVSFTNDGRFLVVTELATDRILSFPVRDDGHLGPPRSVTSSGQVPFGFAFDPSDHLIVSEATNAVPEISTVSSYSLDASGEPTVISASVPNHQTAACWVVTTADGRYAYVSNSGSHTISGYSIDDTGSLTLLDDGRTGYTGDGSFASDMTISADGRHLYVLNFGTESIGVFAIQDDGSLTPMPFTGGATVSAVGMVIR